MAEPRLVLDQYVINVGYTPVSSVADYHYCVIWHEVCGEERTLVWIYRLFIGGEYEVLVEYDIFDIVHGAYICDEIIWINVGGEYFMKVHITEYPIRHDNVNLPLEYEAMTMFAGVIYFTMWTDSGLYVYSTGGSVPLLLKLPKQNHHWPLNMCIVPNVDGLQYIIYSTCRNTLRLFDKNGDVVYQKQSFNCPLRKALKSTIVARNGMNLYVLDCQFNVVKQVACAFGPYKSYNIVGDLLCETYMADDRATVVINYKELTS